jgi:hypothetical protein
MSITEEKAVHENMRRFIGAYAAANGVVVSTGVYFGLGLMSDTQGDIVQEIAKGGLAATIGYGTYITGHLMTNVVARLKPEQRRQTIGLVGAAMVMTVCTSAYPFTVKLGQKTFTDAYIAQYLAQSAREKDHIIKQLRRFEAIGTDAGTCEAKFVSMAEAEANGGFSGVRSTGALQTYLQQFASQCQQLAQQIKAAGEVTSRLIEKINKGVALQYAAADNPDLPIHERVAALRQGSETTRSALTEAVAILPIHSVKSLGQALQGPQVEPSLSNKPGVAAGQKKGIEEARKVHEAVGRELVNRTEDLEAALTKLPSVFKLPSPAELPLMFISKALPIASIVLALDMAIYLFAFFLARQADAEREGRRLPQTDAYDEVISDIERGNDQPLGPHPHPNSTKARTNPGASMNGARSRGNETMDEQERNP